MHRLEMMMKIANDVQHKNGIVAQQPLFAFDEFLLSIKGNERLAIYRFLVLNTNLSMYYALNLPVNVYKQVSYFYSGITFKLTRC